MTVRKRIKAAETERLVGASRWSLYRWVDLYGFPAPHKLDVSKDNIWYEDEVVAWLDQHVVTAKNSDTAA